jgi:hypothetical protein
MPAEPILTLGELEPERPTVAVNRNAPDGPWQRFKHRHFDVLLRWFPVRYAWSAQLYELRIPSEFGLAQSARLQRLSASARELIGDTEDPAKLARLVELLTEFCSLVLIAPREVIDGMDLDQKARLAMAFQLAVTGPRSPGTARPRSSTSAASSPASPASTTATAGGTG